MGAIRRRGLFLLKVELEMCVEDCDWWGRYETVRMAVGEWTMRGGE